MQTQRFLGELKFYEGDLETADQLFTNALKDPAISPVEQTILLRNLGNVAYMNNKFSTCKEFLEQAMSISQTLDEPEFYARDLMNISAIEFQRGAVDQAIDRTRKAIESLKTDSNPHLAGQLNANLGTFLSVQGEYHKSRQFWDIALKMFRKGVFMEDALQVMRNIALTEYENGNLIETCLQTGRYPRCSGSHPKRFPA